MSPSSKSAETVSFCFPRVGRLLMPFYLADVPEAIMGGIQGR